MFIACSIDGYISDVKNSLEWLNSIPNPEQNDMGYASFMTNVDAIIMGRKTYETIAKMDIEWPYAVPVFILSRRLTSVLPNLNAQIELMKGSPNNILQTIRSKGYNQLYIDGGNTIQQFLSYDLIDELTITTMPLLLGGGSPLFGPLINPLHFELVKSEVFLSQIVQSTYTRKR